MLVTITTDKLPNAVVVSCDKPGIISEVSASPVLVTVQLFRDGKDGKTPEKGVDYNDGEDGLSAYEIAVAGGYVGTEAQWIISLKGANGVGIIALALVYASGLEKYYRIDFSDGTFFNYTVTDGASGANGRGITSIVKTGVVGLVDTYRITYTDATTFDYTVTNGAVGANGRGITSVVKIGTAGSVDTYRMTFTDATFVDYTVTNAAVSGYKLVSASSAQNTNTGTTVETILKSIFIPAGTFANGDIMRIREYYEKSGGNGTSTLRLRYNTINSMSGASLLAASTSFTTGQKNSGFERNLMMTPSGIGIVGGSSSANITDVNVFSTSTLFNTNYDFTLGFYLLFTVTASSALDDIIQLGYSIERLRT